jgi:hypothetical protein
MVKKRVCFEELLIAIDVAGRLQGDDMQGNANPQKFAPKWANSIEEISVVCASNIDALGKSIGYAILEGSAFPDGPHEICMGGAGAEDVDAAHSPVPATPLKDMGIRVNGGGDYTVNFQWVGDTVDEGVFCIQLTFDSKAPRKPKQWIARMIETAAVNTNVQAQTLAAVAATVLPGNSQFIDGIIKATSMDFAALGCHAGVMLLSDGCPPNEILCGGGGGENQTAAGGNTVPTQETDCQIPLNGDPIYVEARGVGEAGTISVGVSLGLTK